MGDLTSIYSLFFITNQDISSFNTQTYGGVVKETQMYSVVSGNGNPLHCLYSLL